MILTDEQLCAIQQRAAQRGQRRAAQVIDGLRGLLLGGAEWDEACTLIGGWAVDEQRRDAARDRSGSRRFVDRSVIA